MGNPIGRAVLEISVDDRELKQRLGQLPSEVEKVGKSVDRISSLFTFAVAVKGAQMLGNAIKTLGGYLVELGTHGADVADVSGAFADLSARAEQTADVMLNELRNGVSGTLSDFELMKIANAALSTGFVTSAKDMGTLASGAKLLADRTGGDAKNAFDTLMGAISSGRTAQLKQLGLFVDSDKAARDYALAHHKLVGDLSDSEKAAALAQGTIGALQTQLALAGPPTKDFADVVAIAKAALANFNDAVAVGVATSPGLQAALGTVGQAIGTSFGGNQTLLVQSVVKAIEGLAIGVTYAGQAGALAAGGLVTAFSAVKLVVLGDIMIVSALAETFAKFIDGLATMGSKIPIIGKQVEGFAAGAHSLRLALGGATQSLADQTKEAYAGVTGNSALHQTIDLVAGTFINMRDAIYDADGAARTAATTTTQALATLGPAVQTAAQQVGTGGTLLFQAVNVMSQGINAAITTSANETQKKTLDSFSVMKSAALSAYSTLEQAAGAYGFKSRAELQAEADKAKATYDAMLASGKYTFSELQKAKENAGEAQAKVDDKVYLSSKQKFDLILSSATGTLRSLFGKNKSVALAAAIADGAAAVVASYKNAGGWPWGVAPALAMAAAAAAQVATIRKTNLEGFEVGTPGLDYMNFGSVFPTNLHGEEAVIPRGGGHLLAGEIAAAMPGSVSNDDVLAELRGLRSLLQDQPVAIKKAFLAALRSA